MFTCFGVLLMFTGEMIDASDAAMTSDQQQVSAPPRPTRRLTGLCSHTLPDHQHSSLSSAAATDTELREEASPGERLLT